jgi:hypothetical protein
VFLFSVLLTNSVRVGRDIVQFGGSLVVLVV